MQSFAYQVKSELCRVPVQRSCCARAEAYGVLLYCNTFNAREIRIITENPEFAKRLPKLFHKAFNLRFAYRCSTIRGSGVELTMHRGAFLSGGSVTDPEKRYHLELAGNHRQASRELSALLTEMGFLPRMVNRGAATVIYFKQSEHIEDFLTKLGAPVAAMDIMTTKVDKAIRNGANRAMNCDIANVNKILEAATEQQSAIETLAKSGKLDRLPEKLQQTAKLRLEHPELSLSQLAELCDPPVSKSCMNHRMRKLNEEAKKIL